MVVNGSLSKTAVNGSAGAKSQVSGLVVAALTVLTLLFLTSLFELLPESVLAAVVIAAVIELVDFGSLRRLYQVWTGPLSKIYRFAARTDFIAAVGALVGVPFFDTLPGLVHRDQSVPADPALPFVAPYVSMLARQPAEAGLWVDLARNRALEVDRRINVVRVESGLFFANADYVRARIEAVVTDQTKLIILDGETMPFVDVSGASMLRQLDTELGRTDVELLLARDIGQVRDVMSTAQIEGLADQIYPSVDDAYQAGLRRMANTRGDSGGRG